MVFRVSNLTGPELLGMLDRGWALVNLRNGKFQFQKFDEHGNLMGIEGDNAWNHDKFTVQEALKK